MGGTCSRNERDGKYIQNFIVKNEEKIPVRRYSNILEYNIKIDLNTGVKY